jgi:hypothetical protein
VPAVRPICRGDSGLCCRVVIHPYTTWFSDRVVELGDAGLCGRLSSRRDRRVVFCFPAIGMSSNWSVRGKLFCYRRGLRKYHGRVLPGTITWQIEQKRIYSSDVPGGRRHCAQSRGRGVSLEVRHPIYRRTYRSLSYDAVRNRLRLVCRKTIIYNRITRPHLRFLSRTDSSRAGRWSFALDFKII